MRRSLPMLLAGLIGAYALMSEARAEQAPPPKQPEELGQVPWLRDYDTAIKQAHASGKPLLVLFQEVPG